MGLFYSPSAGGFFDTSIHGLGVPADGVSLTAEQHRALLQAQEEGKLICHDDQGRPYAAAPSTPKLEERRQMALRRIRAETRRRILAVATLEQQANDNAAIAMQALQIAQTGASTLDAAPAVDRRTRIDALRAAGNALESEIAGMKARELTGLDIASATHWPN